MRIAIFSRPGRSFVPVLTASLARMLDRLGVESKVFWLGDLALSSSFFTEMWTEPRRLPAAALRASAGMMLRRMLRDALQFDAIVFVSTAPVAFLRHRYCAIETWLRRQAPEIPVVLYTPEYHAANNWFTWLARGNPRRKLPPGQWGLDRYDWYLCCRAATVFPLPAGTNPVTEIGICLNDGSLRCEQNGQFTALLDFYRPSEHQERLIQIESLKETGVPYIELKGSYSLSQIRAVYRTTAIYFVSFLETFGIPICETQACGNKVFTPIDRWCSAHWQDVRQIQPVVYEGELPENFVVYRDKKLLTRRIREVAEAYDPQATRAAFLRATPEYYHGNEANLRVFLDKLAARAITGASHTQWREIVSRDYYVAHNIDFYGYR
jgi:hypothetical protein